VKVKYLLKRRKTEIMDVVAYTKKANKELGWEPKVSFDDGLKRYINWYKKNI
jgi:nucleoside-diphosphate-sugar epimerase